MQQCIDKVISEFKSIIKMTQEFNVLSVNTHVIKITLFDNTDIEIIREEGSTYYKIYKNGALQTLAERVYYEAVADILREHSAEKVA